MRTNGYFFIDALVARPIPLLSPQYAFMNLYRQLETARNLPLENPSRIILRRRRPQIRHVLSSISRYRILVLIRIIQVYELMQHPHAPGRFVRFLHDPVSRLLHESIGGCGGPEGAEEKYCKHQFSASGFYTWDAGFHSKRGDWYLPMPLPSPGVVPSELPPFNGPNFVTCVGNGSKARLHNIPPGTRG